MTRNKRVFSLLALVLLVFGLGQRGARAQFNSSSATASTTLKPGEKRKTTVFGSVAVLPVAVFDVGGAYSSGVAGTQSLLGSLIAADVGTRDIKSGVAYSVGGWYWGRTGNDLYEVHARLLTSRGLGFQAGYLNTVQGFNQRPINGKVTRGDAEAYDLFLIYNLSSTSLGLNKSNPKRPAWSLEFGAGLYIDVAQHLIITSGAGGTRFLNSNNGTANYTFYVNGSYQIAPRWNVIVSEWIIHDNYQYLNRVAAGVGFSF